MEKEGLALLGKTVLLKYTNVDVIGIATEWDFKTPTMIKLKELYGNLTTGGKIKEIWGGQQKNHLQLDYWWDYSTATITYLNTDITEALFK